MTSPIKIDGDQAELTEFYGIIGSASLVVTELFEGILNAGSLGTSHKTAWSGTKL